MALTAGSIRYQKADPNHVLFIYIEFLILHDATSKEKHNIRRSLEPV